MSNFFRKHFCQFFSSAGVVLLLLNQLSCSTLIQVSHRNQSLLLILHGTGESSLMYENFWKEDAKKSGMMVLAPQIAKSYSNSKSDLEELNRLLNLTAQKNKISKEKIFILGISSGATIASWFIRNYPDSCRAAIVVHPYPINEFEGLSQPVLIVAADQDSQYHLNQLKLDELVKKYPNFTVYVDAEAGHEYKKKWNEVILTWLRQKQLL